MLSHVGGFQPSELKAMTDREIKYWAEVVELGVKTYGQKI